MNPRRRNNANRCDKQKEDSTENSDNELLMHLLQQLRPFQREAYDFATQGLTYGRQCSVATSSSGFRSSGPNTSANGPSNNENFFCDPELLGKGRILLADEMGLGKSITSLAIMAHYASSEWPLLILCPASLRHTWPNEIEKFMPSLSTSSVYVVQGFNDADFFENEYKRKRIKIVVATYSLLQSRSAAAKCLQQFKFKCVIADESHNLKQKNSQRTQLAMPLLTSAKHLVLLSGTPALARPVELWTQISAIAPNLFADNYTKFTKRYCNARRGRFGWDVNGLSNPDELHAKLKQIMVRRLKCDVLHELPAKQRSIVPIAIQKNSKERKECEAIIQDLQNTRKSLLQLVGDEADEANFEARKLLMQAYQASGMAKVSGVCDYLLEWLRGSTTQKVLVFAHHKGVLDALEIAVAKEFKGRSHIRIDGTVASQERALRVKKFQTASHVRVALLSMTAAGVGLTLTAATTVMFAELHWTPGVLAQAEDRCHRIGQKNAVSVQYLVSRDQDISVDMQLWNMLGRKIGTLGRVVDGERNAHLKANLVEERNASGAMTGGQSVQDELQDFFAETSPDDLSSSSQKKTPVKGSIMSFFQKQTTNSGAKKASKTTTAISSIWKDKSSSNTVASPEQRHDPLLAEVVWACESCTFLNTKMASTARQFTCEMCGRPHYHRHSPVSKGRDQESTNPTVTPPDITKPRERCQSELKKHKVNDVVILEDDTTGHEQVSNTQFSSASESDPIIIDSPVTIRKKRSTLLSNECNDSTSSILTKKRTALSVADPIPKKESGSSGRPIILDDENGKLARDFIQQPLHIVKSIPSGIVLNNCTRHLTFSVSRNSGRISIHYACTGKLSRTNFELEQVLTEACSDSLKETQLHRKSARSGTGGIPIEFDVEGLRRVVNTLDRCQLDGAGSIESRELQKEIEAFVEHYLQLREIEKKVLKDSEDSFSGVELKQAVLKMMTTTTGDNSTVRYFRGARERARERLANDSADATDMAVLEGRLCAWCGGKLPSVFDGLETYGRYCKHECADRDRLNKSQGIRAQLFALEGGVCRLCGINAYALFTRISALQPAERLNALCNVNWKLPQSSKALGKLLTNPKEADFWEADHIKAVAEGGGGCGLDNIRTLCLPCHQEETQKLRARLKLQGGAPLSSESSEKGSSKRQRDIRSMFSVVPSCQKTKRSRNERVQAMHPPGAEFNEK